MILQQVWISYLRFLPLNQNKLFDFHQVLRFLLHLQAQRIEKSMFSLQYDRRVLTDRLLLEVYHRRNHIGLILLFACFLM